MHMIIRTIVYAKTKAEVMQQARTVFDKLTGEGQIGAPAEVGVAGRPRFVE